MFDHFLLPGFDNFYGFWQFKVEKVFLIIVRGNKNHKNYISSLGSTKSRPQNELQDPITRQDEF